MSRAIVPLILAIVPACGSDHSSPYPTAPSLPVPQHGEPTFYPKRTRKDDELDPAMTLASQFDHLRIVDNERYPAWFTYRGQRYLLKISKDEA